MPRGAGWAARSAASRSRASESWICSSTNRSGRGNGRQRPGEVEGLAQREVTAGLVASQRLVGAVGRVAQRDVERVGEQLGVAEGVGDAVPGDRVAVVAGVADQCPARLPPPPVAARSGDARRWAGRRGRGPVPRPGRLAPARRGTATPARSPTGAPRAGPAPAERSSASARVGPASQTQAAAVVGREDAGEGVAGDVELVGRESPSRAAGPRRTCRRCPSRRRGLQRLGAEPPRHPGPDAVGADDEVGLDGHGLPSGPAAVDADDPAVAVDGVRRSTVTPVRRVAPARTAASCRSGVQCVPCGVPPGGPRRRGP